MSWLKNVIPPKVKKIVGKVKNRIPDGVWHKCSSCQNTIYKDDLEKNFYVCPKCNYHDRLSAKQRLALTLDTINAKEILSNIKPKDPLGFKDSAPYIDKLKLSQEKLNVNDALLVYSGSIESCPVVVAAFEFSFMGGSMGSVVGEKFVQAINFAISKKLPFLCFSASGGARMQEGLFSLMQMAKTSAALTKLNHAKLPFISILTDPTMGGVSASFAMLGDIIIAEPKALIGFAGPRVIEQTVREKLPSGFQRSEFLQEHGAVDMIIDRRQLRKSLVSLLSKIKSCN
jgi:acetyl-CoA carboxylase carboxyl transferase subunit beta